MKRRATSLRLISSTAARAFARHMAHLLGDNAARYSTTLRVTICATLITILTMGAAFAQTPTPTVPGYSPMRSEQERQNDRTIDRSYESTIKRAGPDTVKNSDPWGAVRETPPAPAAKKKQQ